MQSRTVFAMLAAFGSSRIMPSRPLSTTLPQNVDEMIGKPYGSASSWVIANPSESGREDWK